MSKSSPIPAPKAVISALISVIFEYFLHVSLLYIQNFAPYGQNSLKGLISRLLCRTACGISFNDEYLPLFNVSL